MCFLIGSMYVNPLQPTNFPLFPIPSLYLETLLYPYNLSCSGSNPTSLQTKISGISPGTNDICWNEETVGLAMKHSSKRSSPRNPAQQTHRSFQKYLSSKKQSEKKYPTLFPPIYVIVNTVTICKWYIRLLSTLECTNYIIIRTGEIMGF